MKRETEIIILVQRGHEPAADFAKRLTILCREKDLSHTETELYVTATPDGRQTVTLMFTSYQWEDKEKQTQILSPAPLKRPSFKTRVRAFFHRTVLSKIKMIKYLVIAVILTTSCVEATKYPIYSLKTIRYVPDSLKREYREWITETVRAASGGNNENKKSSIWSAVHAADELFAVPEVGLRKEINENFFDDLLLRPCDLTAYEKKILDSLIVKR